MNRRQYLALAGTATLGAVSGCLDALARSPDDSDDGGWSTAVIADEPALAPGDETTLTLEISDAAGVAFPTLPDETAITFDHNAFEWSPMPFIRTDTIPPHWYWSSRTPIEAWLPVAVASDVPPGEYRYEVRTFSDSNPDSASNTGDFTITVTD